MPFRLSKLKNVKVRIIIVMTFLFVYVLATYIIAEKYFFTLKTNITKPTVKLEYVIVHLDLKGAPPKLTYLESLLPMLKSHGVNGLLIEYEDMFPYEGRLKSLRAVNYYKKKELDVAKRLMPAPHSQHSASLAALATLLTNRNTTPHTSRAVSGVIVTEVFFKVVLPWSDCYKYDQDNIPLERQLKAYLTAAVSAGFEIIPLVQTFGHLQFALKHFEFAHLREVLQFRDSICPSSLESKNFIQEMLKQVIRFHQKITPLNHIHVGCDEVFHLNKCKRCQARNFTNVEIFTSHLKFVTQTVLALSPTSSVLIWDDMFRAVKPFDCANLILSNIEAVYWDYTPNVHDDVHINMYKYGRMFDNLWIATAFKGADGPNEIIPNLKKRFHNHLHWLNFIFDYGTLKNLYNIKGIILTGWSRYQHENPLCELFPASIPSLILNLILIQKYTNGVFVKNMGHIDSYISQHIRSSFDSSLQCKNNTNNFLDVFDSRICDYDESDLYIVLKNLSSDTVVLNNIIQENAYKYYLLQNDTAEFGESKIEYEYVDVINTQKETCLRIFQHLIIIENEIIGLLSDYYENLVILEYVRSKIRGLENTIKGLLDFWKFKGLMKENVPTSNSSIHIKNKSRT